MLAFPEGLVPTTPSAATLLSVRDLLALVGLAALTNSPPNNASAPILAPLADIDGTPCSVRASRLPAKSTPAPAIDEQKKSESVAAIGILEASWVDWPSRTLVTEVQNGIPQPPRQPQWDLPC